MDKRDAKRPLPQDTLICKPLCEAVAAADALQTLTDAFADQLAQQPPACGEPQRLVPLPPMPAPAQSEKADKADKADTPAPSENADKHTAE